MITCIYSVAARCCLLSCLLAGCSWFQPAAAPEAPAPPLAKPVAVAPVEPPTPSAPVVVEPKIVPPPQPPKPAARPKHLGDRQLLVVGAVEWVAIEPVGVRVKARIDTGAETSSLHANPIVPFERDGKRWVRFTLSAPDGNAGQVLERPVARRVRIKRHEAVSQRRYVVKLWLQMGEIRERVEVTLTDRSDFDYPLLVGRNLLIDTAVVDVSRRHLTRLQ